MYKNEASQVVCAQMTTISDGSDFTGSVTCSVTGDGGTRATGSVGSGACTHEGGGLHSYTPSQAETNYDQVSFQFAGSGAATVAVHLYPKERPSSVLFITDCTVSRIFTPGSSTDTFRIEFNVKDHNNTLTAPDSEPTVTLVDQDGSDLTARLDDTTPSAVSTGLYRVTYTATAGQSPAALTLGVTASKSGYVGGAAKFPISLVDAIASVNVTQVGGTSQTAYDIGGSLGAPVGEENISAMILSNTGLAQSIEADTQDIQSRLPAALTGGGNIKADALAISGSTTAADNAEVVFDTDFASNYNATADKWNASVTHYGGTAGTFASGLPDVNVRTHQGHRTHFVAASGGNDSNAGTRALPLATVAQAVTNANIGDTIHMLAGSYSTAINITKAGITLQGDGDATVITVSTTSPTITVGADNVTVRRLKAVATHASSGVAILVDAKNNVTIDGVFADGTFDGIEFWNGCKNGRILNSRVNATFDGLNCSASNLYCFNCEFTSDGSFNSGGSIAGAVVASGGANAKFENCRIMGARTVSSTFAFYGLLVQDSSATKYSTVTCENCEIRATSTHASATGDVAGVTFAEWFGAQPMHLTLNDCTIYTSKAGSQNEYSINANIAGSYVVLARTSVDTAKIAGASYIYYLDDIAADTLADTAEMQGDLADGGRLDLLIDDVPTNSELATAISSGLATYDPPTKAEMDSAISAISGSAETRDLREASKPNQWEMVQRAGGVVSLNPITIYQGETKTVGFDCSRIMSASDVLATMGTPTASDGDLTPTKIGIGPKWANLTLAAANDATAGTGYTVSCTVTTDEGGGPIVLIGNVTVVDD